MSRFKGYTFFKLSQVQLKPVPAKKVFSESEISALNIKTEPWKHGSGPGGQKVNTKASGGRAFCHFNGKKYTATSKKGRDNVYNQGLAKKTLIEDLTKLINKERSAAISHNEKQQKAELLEYKNKPYKIPENIY